MKKTIIYLAFVLGTTLALCADALGKDKPRSPVDSLIELIERSGGIIGENAPSRLPCEVNANPVPYPTSAGPVNLVLKLTPRCRCDGGVEVTVDSVDNLEYSGWREATIENKIGETFTFELPLNIPANDTSGIFVTLQGTDIPWKVECPFYFVTWDDTVEYFSGIDRIGLRPSPVWPPKKSFNPPDSLLHPRPSGGAGYYDEQGQFVPEDSVIDGRAIDGRRVGGFDDEGRFIAQDSLLKAAELQRQSRMLTDSVLSLPGGQQAWKIVTDRAGNMSIVSRQYYLDSLQAYFQHLYDSVKGAELEAKIAEMHQMELTPLSETDVQKIVVGDKLYRRVKGEYKFREVQPIHDRVAHALARRDSLIQREGAEWSEYCFLDLRDPRDYEFTKTIVDSLIRTNETGTYVAYLSPQNKTSLEEKGIAVRPVVSKNEMMRAIRTKPDTLDQESHQH